MTVFADTRYSPAARLQNSTTAPATSASSLTPGWRGPNSARAPAASASRRRCHSPRSFSRLSARIGPSSMPTVLHSSIASASNASPLLRSSVSTPPAWPSCASGTEQIARSLNSRASSPWAIAPSSSPSRAGWTIVASRSSTSSIASPISRTRLVLRSKLAVCEIACTSTLPDSSKPRLTRSHLSRAASSLATASAEGAKRRSWSALATRSVASARRARRVSRSFRSCWRNWSTSHALAQYTMRNACCRACSGPGGRSSATAPRSTPETSIG